MKKILELTTIVACVVCLTSCKNVESKSEDYTKQMIEAIKAGDFNKSKEIYKEYDAWRETLSTEDKKVADSCSRAISKEYMKGLIDNVQEEAEEMIEGMKNATTDAIDVIEESTEQFLDEHEDEINELFEDIDK